MVPDCRNESLRKTGIKKNIDSFNADGFCSQCSTVLEATGCFYRYFVCQEALLVLTEEDDQPGTKTRELGEMRRQYIDENGYTVVKMGECEWWKNYKTDVSIKEHLRKSFRYKRPLRQDQIWDKTKSGALFGYGQCDIKVPEHPREEVANFPPIFENKKKETRYWAIIAGVGREERINVPTTAYVNF